MSYNDLYFNGRLNEALDVSKARCDISMRIVENDVIKHKDFEGCSHYFKTKAFYQLCCYKINSGYLESKEKTYEVKKLLLKAFALSITFR